MLHSSELFLVIFQMERLAAQRQGLIGGLSSKYDYDKMEFKGNMKFKD